MEDLRPFLQAYSTTYGLCPMEWPPNPIREWLVMPMTVVPLSRKQAHRAWQVGMVLQRDHSWVRTLMPCFPLPSTFWDYDGWLARRKLPAQFYLDFSSKLCGVFGNRVLSSTSVGNQEESRYKQALFGSPLGPP